MNKNNDINEDEIRVIGTETQEDNQKQHRGWLYMALMVFVVIVLLLALLIRKPKGEVYIPETDTVETVFEGSQLTADKWYNNTNASKKSRIDISDTMVNDVRLRVYTPYNCKPELFVGELDMNDNSIILCTQAADLRKDNGKILGAFVLKGEPMAWGLSKRGYCAIIDNEMSIGVSDNSPLFELATEREGYFFRQYPLVDNGKSVSNNPENKAVRRALCTWGDNYHLVFSIEKMTMNEFSDILAQMGVLNAIYLVGSDYAHGWVGNGEERTYFSKPYSKFPENINYILFRAK